MIDRIAYKNPRKSSDFEIVGLQDFFANRPHRLLNQDYRLDFWVIIVITDGCGYHVIDFVRYPYKAGNILLIQKNQVHHFEVNKEVQGYIIHINEPFFYHSTSFDSILFLSLMDNSYLTPVLSMNLGKDSTNTILLELLYREYNKQLDELNLDLIAALFQGLLISFNSEYTEFDSILQTRAYGHFKGFRDLIEEHICDHFSVEEYAKMLGVTTKTVNQVTRKITGLSAKQCIVNRMILEIKRLLSQDKLLNYEIADLLGFDEAANMTSFFSRYAGMPPNEFRRLLKIKA